MSDTSSRIVWALKRSPWGVAFVLIGVGLLWAGAKLATTPAATRATTPAATRAAIPAKVGSEFVLDSGVPCRHFGHWCIPRPPIRDGSP